MIPPMALSRLMLFGFSLPILLLLGCQQSSPLAENPTLQTIDPSAIPTSFGEGEHIPALFQLDLDLAAMTGRFTPIQSRRAVSDQATLYDLDLTSFMKPGTLRVTGVAEIDADTVEVTFTHAHPFPAPDWDLPATYLNRADLSYTGRLLILAEVDSDLVAEQSFFGDIVANTRVVEEADGYVDPGDLLLNSGMMANCFPYMLLADELKNNRLGVTNNTIPHGNYNTFLGGWQENNIGEESIGWTGFDFVHAGQTIENTVRFNKTAWNDGHPSVLAALLIKYTDPKGIAGKEIRLPPHDFDILDFCYRVPHGCLDVSQIKVPSLVQVPGTLNAQVIVQMMVRDWDAEAILSPEPDLSVALGSMWIPNGDEGRPKNKGTQPAIAPEFVTLAPIDTGGTGEPNFEFLYEVKLKNTGKWNDGQIRTALYRFDDASFGESNGPAHYGLDAATLAPDAARAVAPVTYQAINVRYGEPPLGSPTPDLFTQSATTNCDQIARVAATTMTSSGDDWFAFCYLLTSGTLEFQRAKTDDIRNVNLYEKSDIDVNPGGLSRLWMGRSTSRYLVAAMEPASGTLRLWTSGDFAPAGPADWTRLDVFVGLAATDRIEGLAFKGNNLTLLYTEQGSFRAQTASLLDLPDLAWTETPLLLSQLPDSDGVTPARYAVTRDGLAATYVAPPLAGETQRRPMHAYTSLMNPDGSEDWTASELPRGFAIAPPLAKPMGRLAGIILIQHTAEWGNHALIYTIATTPETWQFSPLLPGGMPELTTQAIVNQPSPNRLLVAADTEAWHGLTIRTSSTATNQIVGFNGAEAGEQDLTLVAWNGGYAVLWVSSLGSLRIATPI